MSVHAAGGRSITSAARSPVTDIAAAALLTGCLCIPVLFLLMERIPATAGQPLAAEPEAAVPVAIPIPGSTVVTTDEPYSIHQIRLIATDVRVLMSYPEIQLLVATYGTHPRLERAELRIGATGCVYTTA